MPVFLLLLLIKVWVSFDRPGSDFQKKILRLSYNKIYFKTNVRVLKVTFTIQPNLQKNLTTVLRQT